MTIEMKEQFERILKEYAWTSPVTMQKPVNEIICELMQQAYELNRPEWISVEKETPNDDNWYRVLVDGMHHILPATMTSRGKWYFYGDSCPYDNITHWMPFKDLTS